MKIKTVKKTGVILSISMALMMVFAVRCMAAVSYVDANTYVIKNGDTLAQTGEKYRINLEKEYEKYLKDRFEIDLPDIVTKGFFVDCIEKISSTDCQELSDAEKNSELTYLEAVSLAVKCADLKELAYTYPKEKAVEALKSTGITYNNSSKLSLQNAQELATAIQTEMLPVEFHKDFKLDKPLDKEFAVMLLGKVISFRGEYKNYLGYIDDADIYNKVYKAWKSYGLIQADELRAVVDEALKQDIVTGYNVKDTRFNANFDPELTITYGHSDITHAVQLIGLLRSEGLNAKVQLEPKSSAFIYLKEWGEPQEYPDYQVVQIENGNYIAYDKEYDMSFEFDTKEQKEEFQNVIFKYAKRNQEDVTGLILNSWWQPLYSSLVEMKDYVEITNNYIEKDHFIAQSFSLNDKSEEVVKGFKNIDPNIEVRTYKFWVDKPFYNYLIGDYK